MLLIIIPFNIIQLHYMCMNIHLPYRALLSDLVCFINRFRDIKTKVHEADFLFHSL